MGIALSGGERLEPETDLVRIEVKPPRPGPRRATERRRLGKPLFPLVDSAVRLRPRPPAVATWAVRGARPGPGIISPA